MGRKSGAEEGPVHSPKGRHNAMKQKKRPNKNTKEQTKTPTSQNKTRES